MVNTEQLSIRRIESKMKEFDTSFVESLLEGVKSICDKRCLCFIEIIFFYLEINSLIREKNGSVYLFSFFRYLILTFVR